MTTKPICPVCGGDVVIVSGLACTVNPSHSRIQPVNGTSRTKLQNAISGYRPPGRKPNIMVDAFGETKSLSSWVNDPRCVVGVRTIRDRIKRGWCGIYAITLPVQK